MWFISCNLGIYLGLKEETRINSSQSIFIKKYKGKGLSGKIVYSRKLYTIISSKREKQMLINLLEKFQDGNKIEVLN